MPRPKKNRVYRYIGLTPEHDRWVNAQMKDGAERNQVIEEVIERIRRLQETASKVGDVMQRLDKVEGGLKKITNTMDRLKAAEEFRIWTSVGRNVTAYNAYLAEFEAFLKEDVDGTV